MKYIPIVYIRMAEVQGRHFSEIPKYLDVEGLVKPKFLAESLHLGLFGIRPENSPGRIRGYNMKKDKGEKDNS